MIWYADLVILVRLKDLRSVFLFAPESIMPPFFIKEREKITC